MKQGYLIFTHALRMLLRNWKVALKIILPAGVVDAPIGLGAAWQAARGAWGPILGMMVLMFCFLFVIGLFAAIPILGAVLDLVLSLFVPFLQISLITTH